MPTFKQGDVVRVPFPYIERNVRQHRPALVISSGLLGPNHNLLWVAMITAAANKPWPTDCPIDDFAAINLPIPSVVRVAKIATIQSKDAQVIGILPAGLRDEVMRRIANLMERPVE